MTKELVVLFDATQRKLSMALQCSDGPYIAFRDAPWLPGLPKTKQAILARGWKFVEVES